jgi:hypothetical protein
MGLQLTRNCQRGDHVSAGASACYQNAHAIAASRLNASCPVQYDTGNGYV